MSEPNSDTADSSEKYDIAYEWDEKRNAWFPKIDDDFLAKYQMNYGSYKFENTLPIENTESQKINKDKNSFIKKSIKDSKEEWFNLEDEKNNYIYASGFPNDITEQEFIEFFSKCGIIMKDDRGNHKIKLYKDSNGNNKGDGRCCFLRKESIELAIKILDESEIRGSIISVQKAVFAQKGDYNKSLKPKKKRTKKNNDQMQNKNLDWIDRGEKKSKNQYIVVFHNFYDPIQCETLDGINQIKFNLSAMCKNYGEIRKIMLFERHPEAVCSCAFKSFESAQNCLKSLDGTIHKGKLLKALIWDGVTDYNIVENDKEYDERIKHWEEFLEK